MRTIKVQCECKGMGFIPQVDSAGADTDYAECAAHHPAYQGEPNLDRDSSNIEVLDRVSFLDGAVGTVSQWEGDGIAKVYMGRSAFDPREHHYRYVHKSELTKINN